MKNQLLIFAVALSSICINTNALECYTCDDCSVLFGRTNSKTCSGNENFCTVCKF